MVLESKDRLQVCRVPGEHAMVNNHALQSIKKYDHLSVVFNDRVEVEQLILVDLSRFSLLFQPPCVSCLVVRPVPGRAVGEVNPDSWRRATWRDVFRAEVASAIQ